ncbi:MAG: hypothetical protein KDA61_20115 [Planctomycetales bacterium]|nr:hypothetical protein [Planctomycetales bacterium]
MQSRRIRVSSLVWKRSAQGARVSARVDGRRINFETQDVELCPAPEALGSCFLIPALHAQRALELSEPVCTTWCENAKAVLALATQWWSYPPVEPVFHRGEASSRRADRTALCFTCGVDSFHSLLCAEAPIDGLATVLGYDVSLKDRPRLRSLENSVRRVAAHFDVKPLIVTSNLRCRRAFTLCPWERSHGGALAAIGHLLSDHYDRLIISSSIMRDEKAPWGSHWQLDHRFSSCAMTVVHHGERFDRVAKLSKIAHEPIVRRHLRVCWEHRNSAANCGACEKCVRTMCILDACGQLGRFSTFQLVGRLDHAIDALASAPVPAQDVYRRLLELGLSSSNQSAVVRLLARSERPQYAAA